MLMTNLTMQLACFDTSVCLLHQVLSEMLEKCGETELTQPLVLSCLQETFLLICRYTDKQNAAVVVQCVLVSHRCHWVLFALLCHQYSYFV